jgi:hypothetical protein
MKFKATARLVSDNTGIRLQFSYDVARLWNWFILKETGMILHTAMRPSKIGLHRYYSYHKSKPNEAKLKILVGKKFQVGFELSRTKVLLSRKGYWVSFIPVMDDVVWKLLDDLKLTDNFDLKKDVDLRNLSRYNLPHLSIANGKYFKAFKEQKSKKWLWDNQFTTTSCEK